MRILFIIFLACASTIYGQVQNHKCYSVDDLLHPYSDTIHTPGIYKELLAIYVTTNIMAYNNSRFFLDSSQRYNKFSYFERKGLLLYLNPCEHFIFNFKVSSLSFPGYQLIEFSIPDMKVGYYRHLESNDTCITKINIPISRAGRLDGHFHGDLEYIDSSNLRLMQKGLLLDQGVPIFISGQMYLDDIADGFFKNDIRRENHNNPLDLVNPSTFEQYIKVRYFNYDPESIQINMEKYTAAFYSPITKKTHTCSLKIKSIITYSGYKRLSIAEDFE